MSQLDRKGLAGGLRTFDPIAKTMNSNNHGTTKLFGLGNPFVLFFVTAGMLLAIELLVVNVSAFAAHGNLLSLAVTADITIGIPLVYFVLVVRRKHLPAITVAPVFVLCLVLAGRILPPENHVYLDKIELAVPLVELTVVVLVAFKARQILALFRQLRPTTPYAPEAFELALQRGLGAVPPIVGTLLTTELSLVIFAFTGWFRKARPPRQNVQAFFCHRQGSYPVVLGFLVFMVLLETTVVHLLLQRWSPTAAIVVTLATVYTLVWLFGDLHAMRLQPTLVSASHVHVRTGMRWRMDIPLALIDRIEKVASADKKADDFLSLAPIGEARLVMHLVEPVQAVGLLGRRKLVSRVGVALDDDKGFAAALSAAQGRARPGSAQLPGETGPSR